MRIRHILALGLAVNCGLIAGVVWQSSQERMRSRPVVHESSLVSAVASRPTGTLAAPVAPGLDEVAIERPFRWADLESENYLELIGNLRSAGCPDSTVADIVLARVAEDFAGRRWALLKPMQSEFWDRLARGGNFSDWEFPDTIESRFNELRREAEKVLADLRKELGVKAAAPDVPEAADWDFLPPERLAEVRQLSVHFKSLIDQIEEPVGGNRALAVKVLVTERDEALRLLVGDALWREHELRRGAATRWLRGTSGLTLDAAEMRALTAAWQANGIDPRRLTMAERRDALAAVVGGERAEDYLRRTDAVFEPFQKVARRHGLPREAADRAIRVKATAVREATAIRERAYGSEDVRARAAAALIAGVRAELAGIYGEQAWPTLQKYGLSWIDGLFGQGEAGR